MVRDVIAAQEVNFYHAQPLDQEKRCLSASSLAKDPTFYLSAADYRFERPPKASDQNSIDQPRAILAFRFVLRLFIVCRCLRYLPW